MPGFTDTRTIVSRVAKHRVVCKMCGLSFTDRAAKNRHEVDDHGVEMVAVCEQCGKGFKSRLGYRYHMKHHDMSAGKTDDCLKCPKCDKFFSNISFLESHLFSHSEQKSVVCEICGKSYKRQSALKRHKMESCGKKY